MVSVNTNRKGGNAIMGTKNNPGPIDCYKAAAPDEPIFVLRSTDSMGGLVVRIWAEIYRARKTHANEWNDAAESKYMEALECSATMDDYYVRTKKI